MRRLTGLIGACTALGLAVAAAPAADPVPGLDRTAVDVLKDVHNRGAELYNRGDAAGCYRMYEGALTTVRPFLAHRPAVQKVIADGLAEVAGENDPKAQAFRLHEVIEQVRASLKEEMKKPAAEAKAESPKPAPKPGTPKADTPAPEGEPKKVGPKPGAALAAGGTLGGTVTLDGQPLDRATVMMVSLTLKEPRVFTAETMGGVYEIGTPVPAGQYAISVSGPKVPAKYQELGKGGIRLDVKPGPGKLNIDLRSK